MFSTLDDETGKKLDEVFGVKPSLMKVHPSRCLIPPKFIFYAQKIRDMPVYEDDIWMLSFPRTGECLKIIARARRKLSILYCLTYKKKIELGMNYTVKNFTANNFVELIVD